MRIAKAQSAASHRRGPQSFSVVVALAIGLGAVDQGNSPKMMPTAGPAVAEF
jgi:hypothetical protein